MSDHDIEGMVQRTAGFLLAMEDGMSLTQSADYYRRLANTVVGRARCLEQAAYPGWPNRPVLQLVELPAGLLGREPEGVPS